MSTSIFNPESPHVSVSLYVDNVHEVDTFASICWFLQEQGSVPYKTLKVAPSHKSFEWTTDLADVKEDVETEPHLFERLISGEEPEWRVTEAAFEIPKVGVGVVRYEPAAESEPHPVAVIVHGGSLGEPDQGRRARRQAKEAAQWAQSTLTSAAVQLSPLYGAIGVEETLPSPSYMREGDAEAGGQLFVSTRLLARDLDLEPRLRECFNEGKTSHLSNGLLFYDWVPFGRTDCRVTNVIEVQRRAARLLDQAISRS